MNTVSRRLLALIQLSSAFASTALLAAQTNPKPPTSDELVEISPFVVTASQDVGYLAGNTLAGSRMNTPLKDTAASLSVLTEEFIKDLGATNLAEVLEYTNNIQFDREDAGAFGDNTSGGNAVFSQTSDNFRVRGQKASLARNYFNWDLPVDTFNIERVEESRGPNSILFGIGSAGGLISASSKQGITTRSFRKAGASTDSNGSYRGTFDVNQAALDHKLGVRVNAVYSNSESYRLFVFDEQKRIHVAAKYEIDRKTRIRAEFETGIVRAARAFVSNLHDGPIAWNAAGRPTFDTPATNSALRIALRPSTRRVTYLSDGNRSADRIIDMASTGVLTNSSFMILDHNIIDPTVNVAGPGALARTSFDTPSLFIEHQFGDKTFLELAYNHQNYRFRGVQPQGDAAFLGGDPNNRLRDGTPNPYAKRYYIESSPTMWTKDFRSDSYRATLSTEFNYGKWGNYRLAAMGEYEVRAAQSGPLTEVWAGAPFSALPESAANQVFRRGYVTEGNWSSYHTPLPGETGLVKGLVDPVSGRTLSSTWVRLNSSVADDPSDQKTWLVGGQARYFGGRLIAGFGYRSDRVHALKRNSLRDAITQEWVTDYANGLTTDTDGSTRTLGVVGHVTSHISLMYNQSSNLALPPVTQRHTVTGEPLVSAEGEGKDMGLAFDLFGGRMYARATYFESNASGTNAIRFGGTNTNPNSVATIILTTLRGAGAITQAEQDAHTPAVGTSSYLDNVAKGYEFSLTANMSKNWRLQANYSISGLSESNIASDVTAWLAKEKAYWQGFNRGAVVTSNNSNTVDQVIQLMQDAVDQQKAVENRGAIGNRRHKVNVFTRYSFSQGWMKGAYIGGGYRHQGKMLIGKDFNNELQYGNSYWLADLLLGYTFPQNLRFLKNWNVQLNVMNLFDADRPLVSRVTPEVPIARNKQQAEQAPRLWRLTTNFAF